MTNTSPDDATLSYLESGQMKEQNITKGSVSTLMMSFTSNVQPADVEFKAFKQGTATVININGSESLMVTPTEYINTIPVFIGKGKYLTFS